MPTNDSIVKRDKLELSGRSLNWGDKFELSGTSMLVGIASIKLNELKLSGINLNVELSGTCKSNHTAIFNEISKCLGDDKITFLNL